MADSVPQTHVDKDKKLNLWAFLLKLQHEGENLWYVPDNTRFVSLPGLDKVKKNLQCTLLAKKTFSKVAWVAVLITQPLATFFCHQ